MEPIPMILHCPECGRLHIDAPKPDICLCGHPTRVHREDRCDGTYRSLNYGTGLCLCKQFRVAWDNPPHRSHKCQHCGCIWRPADVPTVGVEVINTRGKNDTWPKV